MLPVWVVVKYLLARVHCLSSGYKYALLLLSASSNSIMHISDLNGYLST